MNDDIEIIEENNLKLNDSIKNNTKIEANRNFSKIKHRISLEKKVLLLEKDLKDSKAYNELIKSKRIEDQKKFSKLYMICIINENKYTIFWCSHKIISMVGNFYFLC